MSAKVSFGIVIFFALRLTLIASGSHPSAPQAITWGTANAGLRLGIEVVRSQANVDLGVIIENVSSSDLSVFVAARQGRGTEYLFHFTAAAPDGKKHAVWDNRPESGTTGAGLSIPVVIKLSPGKGHEFLFPLKQLVYWGGGGDGVSLQTLLREGGEISVCLSNRLEVWDGAQMGGTPEPSTGRLWIGYASVAKNDY